MNGDKSINISDIMVIVNIILEKSSEIPVIE